jgi:predicted DNA repair protein MutK
MAGSSLFVLIDDIATLLDDVATMTKVATQKTAGVLGDDLAVNAEKVTGVSADRELPVVWAVAKGSLKNKCILVPAALAISTFIPWLIIPLLLCGGVYLCYEGFEKIWHHFFHVQDAKKHHEELIALVKDDSKDIVTMEKEKIQGAIRTDLVLSAEIIVITLGIVEGLTLSVQALVLTVIALTMTVGVYGLVAGIVKLDDLGLYLSRKASSLQKQIGLLLLSAAPWLMKGLSVFGTIAMFIVGGGIISHNLAWIHHWRELLAEMALHLPTIGAMASVLAPVLLDTAIGLFLGAAALLIMSGYQRLITRNRT